MRLGIGPQLKQYVQVYTIFFVGRLPFVNDSHSPSQSILALPSTHRFFFQGPLLSFPAVLYFSFF